MGSERVGHDRATQKKNLIYLTGIRIVVKSILNLVYFHTTWNLKLIKKFLKWKFNSNVIIFSMTLHVHSASCILKELWLFPALLLKKKLAQWFSTRGDFALLHTPLLLLFFGTEGHLATTGDISGGHYQHLVRTGQGCYQTSSSAQCSSRFPPSEKETKTFLPRLSLLLRLRNPALSLITDHSVLMLFSLCLHTSVWKV